MSKKKKMIMMIQVLTPSIESRGLVPSPQMMYTVVRQMFHKTQALSSLTKARINGLQGTHYRIAQSTR